MFRRRVLFHPWHKEVCSLLATLVLTLFCTVPVGAETVFTLWPLVDYRSSENFTSLHLLGPLGKYQRQGELTELALRPLLFHTISSPGRSQTDIVYPFATLKQDQDETRLEVLQLFSLRSEQSSDSGSVRRSFTLFPLLFHGHHAEFGSYTALFPLGGTLYDRFGRDRIDFWLFPLYARSENDGRRVDNLLWPLFSRTSGAGYSGYAFWPFYGWSEQGGQLRRRFFLWPLGFSETRGHPDQPDSRESAFLPFYYVRESAGESYRGLLWPFLTYHHDRLRRFKEWNFPWPLVRMTRGEHRHGLRLLPFYADETLNEVRKRWYLWPLFKNEQLQDDFFDRREFRLAYFLYRNLDERHLETGAELRRIHCWPLLGYRRSKGVSHLYLFSLLEPFLPDNERLERSWSPLWRFFQIKWDSRGNRIGSLFWNLLWWERRQGGLAFEFFPLVDYRKTVAKGVDLSLFKGLLRYRRELNDRELELLYLPWPISWSSK
ncbi:MAG: hypothetical protein C0614_14145 [Desulfuromonas sp.]|nr:MAG: hypothetical protein C0614_14145 [Desulfuromonas sp.]